MFLLKKPLLRTSLIAVILLITAAAFAAEPIPTVRPNLDPLLVAHRGAKVFRPENTLSAYENAIKLGFDYVELDVRYTRDGVPVCMHDEKVNRTTGADGYVKDFTAEEITKLDAARGFFTDPEKFKDTPVPTLEQALQLMQGKIKLYMDQKEMPTPALVELLKKYNFLPDNIIVVGENEFQKAFRELVPDAPVMPNASTVEELEPILKEFPEPYAFNTTCPNIKEDFIDAAHERGIRVFINTLGWCDQPILMEKMINLGPDGMQSDQPQVLVPLLKKLKKKGQKAEGRGQ